MLLAFTSVTFYAKECSFDICFPYNKSISAFDARYTKTTVITSSLLFLSIRYANVTLITRMLISSRFLLYILADARMR